MATFQSTVLIIAIVILIIVLIIIGIVLNKGEKNQVWPPSVGDCPDYWVDTSGNGANCVNVKDLGTCKATSGKHLNKNFTTSLFSGSDGGCAKYTWANSCGISWDGITYGVTNPCTKSSNTSDSSSSCNNSWF